MASYQGSVTKTSGHRRIRSRLAVAGLVLAAAFLTPQAAAQDNLRQLITRMERLERDINTVQRQVFRGTDGKPTARGTMPPPPPAAAPPGIYRQRFADMTVRITEIEDQLRTLTGHWEESSHKLDSFASRLEKLISDVDFRLSVIERKLAATTVKPPEPAGEVTPGTIPEDAPAAGTIGTLSSTEAAAPTPPAQPALPEGTPKEQYDHAFGLLQQADYGRAEKALQAFIEGHPKHELTGNAYYWLGETYYVRENYEQAAVTFLKAFQTFPKSNKAPANLLKLGMTFGRLGGKKEACATFDKLATEFPKAPANIRGKAESERKRLDCR